VLFTAMQSGARFPAAPDRLRNDSFVPLQQTLRSSEYSQGFLAAVDWALQFRGQDRPQNIAAWRTALNAAQPGKAGKAAKGNGNLLVRLDQLRKRDSRSFWKLIIVVAIVLLGAIAIAAVLTYLMSSAT
jgi:hypothetical protein